MNILDYFLCFFFIVIGIYFFITDWRRYIYNGIIKRHIIGSTPFGKKWIATGKKALINGIGCILLYSAFIIIPLYFIIKNLLK